MYLSLLSGLFLLRYIVGRRIYSNRLAYWFVFVALFLFSAFRFRVGCDWSGYYFNFTAGEGLDYQAALSYREPVWWIVQAAFNNWGLPYPSVNVLTSAICFAGVHALAKRQPDRIGFLVLLFPILIINMPMSGIRQAAAIGFLCFSFTAFIDRKLIWFIAWVLIGSTFHSSVLTFLLLAPLTTGSYTRQRLMVSAVLAIPGAFYLVQSEAAQVAVDRYVDSGIDAFGALFRVGLLVLTGVLFFWHFRRRWYRYSIGDYGLVSVGAWLMLLLFPILGLSSVIADRLGYYLVPIQAIILSRIPFLGFSSNRKVLTALPYVGLVLVFAVWSAASGLFELCYVPYQSWIFGHDDFGLLGF